MKPAMRKPRKWKMWAVFLGSEPFIVDSDKKALMLRGYTKLERVEVREIVRSRHGRK